jgi:hypothetical protein
MNEGEPAGELGPLPTKPEPYSSSLLVPNSRETLHQSFRDGALVDSAPSGP